MIVTERKTDIFERRAGGKGNTIMEHIVDEKVYGGKIAAYARVILKPGCSLGYHKHEGCRVRPYIRTMALKARCLQAQLFSAPKAKATASKILVRMTCWLWR